jgi:hypothetical protein
MLVESKTALAKPSKLPGLSTPPRRVMGVVAHAMRTKRVLVVMYATVATVALFSVTPRAQPSPASGDVSVESAPTREQVCLSASCRDRTRS